MEVVECDEHSFPCEWEHEVDVPGEDLKGGDGCRAGLGGGLGGVGDGLP